MVALAVFQLQYSELSSTTSAVWDGCGVEIESLPKFCKDPEQQILELILIQLLAFTCHGHAMMP